MDRFTVVWSRALEDEFANRWLDADSADRQRLTTIASAIDRGLARNPEAYGHPLPLEPTLRSVELAGVWPPVTVVYKVESADRLVRVVRIYLAL